MELQVRSTLKVWMGMIFNIKNLITFNVCVFVGGFIVGATFLTSDLREYSLCSAVNCCLFVEDGKYITNITKVPGCVELLESSGFNCVFNHTNNGTFAINITEVGINTTKMGTNAVPSSSYTLECPSSSMLILYSMGLLVAMILSCICTMELFRRNGIYQRNRFFNQEVRRGVPPNQVIENV